MIWECAHLEQFLRKSVAKDVAMDRASADAVLYAALRASRCIRNVSHADSLDDGPDRVLTGKGSTAFQR